MFFHTNSRHGPWTAGLLAVLVVAVFHALQAEELKGKKVSNLRQIAYEKSGEWLYRGLSKIKIPQLRPLQPKDSPLQLPVDWKTQAAQNKPGFPLFEPSAVDYGGNSPTATAYLAGFQTKYYQGGPRLLEDYFTQAETTHYLTANQKKDLREHRNLIHERSMVFYLSYDSRQVQLVYYPAKIRFHGGARSNMKAWLPHTPKAFQTGQRTDYALIQDSKGLLSIFNGTFDTVDNFAVWKEQETMQYGGFGYDFRTYMPPQAEMGTIALYEDGHVELHAYKNLKDPKKIRAFIQNRYMVIENGRLAKDSDPDAFCSFYDDIARSYLFIDGKGRIGYLWTLYTPAMVAAKMALQMGVQDMILLDIHSPISCVLSDTGSDQQYDSYRDYMRHSHDFVPNFFRLSPLKASLTWISKALNSRIQTHYVMEAFQGGTEAFFAIFQNGSPEALRVEKPRPAPATGKKN